MWQGRIPMTLQAKITQISVLPQTGRSFKKRKKLRRNSQSYLVKEIVISNQKRRINCLKNIQNLWKLTEWLDPSIKNWMKMGISGFTSLKTRLLGTWQDPSPPLCRSIAFTSSNSQKMIIIWLMTLKMFRIHHKCLRTMNLTRKNSRTRKLAWPQQGHRSFPRLVKSSIERRLLVNILPPKGFHREGCRQNLLPDQIKHLAFIELVKIKKFCKDLVKAQKLSMNLMKT